jgi:iron only hydrogenase large subunit-like protein
MMGAIIKSFFAEKEGIDPKKIFSVSIMPCTAKKFEAERPEMGRDGVQDIDAVLTTREFAQLLRKHGLDPKNMQPSMADTPFGERSSAGKIFATSGGVMEAALRSAHFLLTGEEIKELDIKKVRGFSGIKEASVDINGTVINVAVASGLANARDLLEQVKAGKKDLHFIEVMTCPGGCIAGGGQPLDADPKALRARMRALYKIDRNDTVRVSHKNESIKRLYKEFLGEPLGHKSHELLHTKYGAREVVR